MRVLCSVAFLGGWMAWGQMNTGEIAGSVRDLSGGFAAVLWVLVGAGVVLVLLDSSFSPARLAAGRSSAEPPLQAASS